MAYNEALPKLSKQKQVSAYYNLGTAHLQKKDVKSAIEAYKEVLKLDPNHVKTRQNIELALRQQNQSSQSLSNDKMNEDTDEQEKDQDSSTNAANNPSEDQGNIEENSNENSSDDEKNNAAIPSESNELNEQQIQALVDSAERTARKKKQKDLESLFRGSEW